MTGRITAMTDMTLTKRDETARMLILGGDDIHDVLALQTATRDALPDSMKMFILPQPITYFQNLLMRQTGVMIGMRREGELIAQMAIMGPLDLREAILLRAISKNDILFHHAALADSVVVFKSMAVHPHWRGNDLSGQLISFALDQPMVRVAGHVFAQISVANRRSWEVFVGKGFGIVAAAQDPADQQPRFVLQKPGFGFDFAPAIIADDVDAIDDFAAIANLTQREGLIGITDSDNNTKLTFMRSRETPSLMPTIARMGERI